MKAPTGAEIVGTDDNIPGLATGGFEDGEFFHAGETEVNWDGQETRTLGGEVVYVDAQYQEWVESQLIAEDAEPLPADQIKPWFANTALREKEIELTIEKLMARLGGEPERPAPKAWVGHAIKLLKEATDR